MHAKSTPNSATHSSLSLSGPQLCFLSNLELVLFGAAPFGGFRCGGTEQDLYTTSLPALDTIGNAQVYRYAATALPG